jgi:hypothetical protein
VVIKFLRENVYTSYLGGHGCNLAGEKLLAAILMLLDF